MLTWHTCTPSKHFPLPSSVSSITSNTAAIDDAKTSPPSLSHSSSFSSDVLLRSESEPEQDTDKDNRHTVSSAPDDVAFMHYVHPLYAPFSPPLPSYYGGSSGSKPPSPPRSSAWDFLNFFEPYERYHEPYSQSGEAEVATEEQGKAIIIGPQNEAEKKCNGGGDRKVVSEAENNSKEGGSVDLVSKKKEGVVSDSDESSNTSSTAKVKAGEGLCERMKKIQNLFDRASDSGNSILELLDVGKLRYHKKLAFNLPCPAVSCKMMNVFVNPSIPSNPLVFKCMETSLLGSRRALNGHAYGNLCSTLKRLCMREKKLHHEVKAEEKLRILHQNKCRQLRRMNKKDNNADAQKVESVKTFIGILATKMKISIQVVDKISNTICKLREEELWPQITRFILMFLGMWKDTVSLQSGLKQIFASMERFTATTAGLYQQLYQQINNQNSSVL